MRDIIRVLGSYRDLKIHRLFRKCTHIVVETEPIFARLSRREHKVPLPLFGGFHDNFAVGGDDIVVKVKRPAGLNLVHKVEHNVH